MHASAPRWLALLVFIAAQLAYAPYADGRMATFDPVMYGEGIAALDGLGSDPSGAATNANHLLYHLVHYLLTGALDAVDFPSANHAATLLLGGAGAAGCVLLIAAFAGRERAGTGTLLAAIFVATRGFVFEAASGETVLPAFALSLWAMRLAAADKPRLGALWLCASAAMLARQDGVWLVPAALVLAWGRARPLPLIGVFAAAGLTCLGAYTVVWFSVETHYSDFVHYVLGIGGGGSWTMRELIGASAPHMLLDAFATALIGRHWQLGAWPVAPVVAFLVLSAATAWLLRGRQPSGRLGLAVVVGLCCRSAFFLWYEPENWEWQVPAVGLCSVAAAGLVAGAPVGSPRARGAGAALGGVLIAALLAGHVRDTLRAQRSDLHDAVAWAVAKGGPDAAYFALGHKAQWLVERRFGLECGEFPDVHAALTVPRDAAQHVEQFATVAAQVPRRAVLIVDCFVRNGQPVTRRALRDLLPRAGYGTDRDRLRVLRWRGVPYGLLSPGR